MFAQASIGCDPEIFVTKNGKYVSAHGMVRGNKQTPYVVDDGSVQVDGTALEIGIIPASTATEFLSRIASVTKQLEAMIPTDCKLTYTPTATYDKEYFDTLPKEATELGCDPDFNAWIMAMNNRPSTDKPIRTGAGHIHVGWTAGKDPFSDAHFIESSSVIRELDYYLGVVSLDWDTDNERRELYGQAGAFRPKSYGAEYRVLSNAWLVSEALTARVYGLVRLCLTNIDKGISFVDKFGDLAVNIINTSNTNWKTEYPELLQYMTELGIYK